MGRRGSLALFLVALAVVFLASFHLAQARVFRLLGMNPPSTSPAKLLEAFRGAVMRIRECIADISAHRFMDVLRPLSGSPDVSVPRPLISIPTFRQARNPASR